MTDPIVAAARYIAKDILSDLRAGLDGLPPEALDWTPGGEDTNSAAVLITHVMHSTRSWLSIAVGAPLPERDRDSEFRVSSDDPAAMMEFFDEFSSNCMTILDSAKDIDWSTPRKTHARPGDAPDTVPAAYALLHAIEHLREHAAHIGLTRQLWEERGR